MYSLTVQFLFVVCFEKISHVAQKLTVQLLRVHSVLEDDIKFLILWCCSFRHLSPDLALEHGKWLMCFCCWQRSVTLGGSTVHLYLYGPCCGVAHRLQHRPRHDLRQQLGLVNILAPTVSLAIQIRMVLLADQRGHRFRSRPQASCGLSWPIWSL